MEKMTIEGILEGYRHKEFSPVEITQCFLDRINDIDGNLNTFITICKDKALNQAKIAEKKYMLGEQTGRIEGIPISYKDMIETKGIRTTYGSLIDKNYIPLEDASVVKILQHQGAINIGKTNLHEYSLGTTSENPFYGPVRNPWNTEYVPGGSSGGSAAAVAAFLGLTSLGTDTGGSIRIPASACGVIGLKPTIGLLDTTGIMNISWSSDHVGPITRNVSDMYSMMEALTENSFNISPDESDIRGLRIGVPSNHFNEQLDDEVQSLYNRSLEQLESLGAVLIDVVIPFSKKDVEHAYTIEAAEARYIHEKRIKSAVNNYGDDVKEALKPNEPISSLSYIKALKRKKQITHDVNYLFNKVDIIATPTIPIEPPKIGRKDILFAGQSEHIFSCMIRYTTIFNQTGHPALSIPCGLTSSKLPVGLQLAGQHYCEEKLLKTAYIYEQHYLNEFYKIRDNLFKNNILKH